MHMYPCPTKSSESNNRKKVFTWRKYYDEIMTACRGLATVDLSFYLLLLLMYARRHWGILEFTIKLIKRKIFQKNGK
jgi:long-subunit acyl-CoA synthetase (AMP-forming)